MRQILGGGVEQKSFGPHFLQLFYSYIMRLLGIRMFLGSSPHQNLAGKASTPHSAVIAAIIVNYIAILHRFLAIEYTNIIEFMPLKRAIPAPLLEPTRKSSRPVTPIKKKVAFQSERDRRAVKREKITREKTERERLEKTERLASFKMDVLDKLLRDEQDRTKARIKKAREVRNKAKDLQFEMALNLVRK
jgi:hypothetical protein